MSTLLETSLSTLLDVSIKSTLLALLATGVLCGLRMRNSNIHHRTWTVVLLAMLAMPLLHELLPATRLTVPSAIPRWSFEAAPLIQLSKQPLQQLPQALQATSDKNQPANETVFPAPQIAPADLASSQVSTSSANAPEKTTAWAEWLLFVYTAGLLVSLGRLAIGIGVARRLVLSGEPVDPGGDWSAPVLQSDAVSVPLTIGVWRPCILLPAEWESWSPAMLLSALHHEQTHVERRDYLLGLLAELNKCFYWFHPLAWFLRKRLANLAEQVCDDLVLAKIDNRTGYAEHLLHVAAKMTTQGGRTISLGVPMARTSQLESRIDAILDATRPLAKRLGLRSKLLFLAAALPIVFVTAGIRAEEKKETVDVATEKISKAEDKTKKTPAPPVMEMSKVVRIVNSNDEPIVGATVTPWAMRTKTGHGSWVAKGYGASEPPVLTTDEEGTVTIRFPRYAKAAEKVRPQALTCRVEHPDYAQTQYNDVSVTEDEIEKIATIKLLPGAQVEVKVIAQGKTLPAKNLHAIRSDHIYDKELLAGEAGTIKLPRFSSGLKLLRMVYLPNEGSPLFSEVQELQLDEGGQLQLELEMKPGITVQGKLDESVPRPVTNGHVIAQVIDFDPGEGYGGLQWRVSTPINADGTFVLHDLPRGNVQVIALCDGFRAKSGSPPDFARQHEINGLRGHPQVFSRDDNSSEITLKMTPTAECEIQVVGPDQEPLADAKCGFWPNVFWWSGGSQVYGYPLYSTAESLRNPELMKKRAMDHSSFPYTAKTNAYGVAVVRGLPEGTTNFNVRHDDYEVPLGTSNRRSVAVNLVAGEQNKASVTLQAKGSQFVGEQVDEQPSQQTQVGVDERSRISKPLLPKTFETQAEATELAGVVIDESGQPLAGVEVDAWTWYPGNETVTDDQGRFRLAKFNREEAVEILFAKEKFSPSYFVAQKAGSDNWTIVLTQGTWIEGKVLSPTGEPVPNATIKAARGPFRNPQVSIDDVTTQTLSDAEGSYRLHLEPDKYAVQVRVPGMGAVRIEDVDLLAKEKKQLDLQLDHGVTFQATVRDSLTNEPVEGFVLWNWRQPEVEGISDENGVLEITGMMEGKFEFNISATDVDRRRSRVAGKYARWWSKQAVREDQREELQEDGGFQRNFDVLSFDLQGDVVQVDLFVEPMVTLKGQVLDPDGNPVAGATVDPAKTGSGNSITGDTRYSYETDAQGQFVMKLPASKNAQYNLVAHDGKHQEWRTWANGVGEPFQTSPGQTIENVELRLTRPATVRGVVTNALGKPRPHVKVQAVPFGKLDNRYYLPETETDAEGKYELKFIRPGKQTIQLESYWQEGHSQIVELEADEVVEGMDFKAD